MLNRIGALNWALINHRSNVSTTLSKLVYLVGTKAKLKFEEYVFNQTLKHADSYVVKLPIEFPCLLTNIILSQYLEIIDSQEAQSKRVDPMIFDKKLFMGTHVLDIELSRHQRNVAGGILLHYLNTPEKRLLKS